MVTPGARKRVEVASQRQVSVQQKWQHSLESCLVCALERWSPAPLLDQVQREVKHSKAEWSRHKSDHQSFR